MLLIGFQVATAKPAHACSCSYSTDWNVRLQHFEAVFAGEVISVQPSDKAKFAALQAITFKVYAGWKGAETSQITIYSDSPMPGNCGVGFSVGERWLISTSGDGGRVATCSLPMPLERASEALAVLGNPAYGSLPALLVSPDPSFISPDDPITFGKTEVDPPVDLRQYAIPIALVVLIFPLFLVIMGRRGRT